MGNTALGVGAGLMQGFNQVLIPFLERQGQAQQQQAIMQTKELRDETRKWAEELMHTGLWDPQNNELDAKANAYLYSGWNTKPPAELAYFFANARNRLTKTADLVGSGSAQVAQAPAAPTAPGTPPTPGAPAQAAGQPPTAPAAPVAPTAPGVPGQPPVESFAQGATFNQSQVQPTADPGTVRLPNGQLAEAPTNPNEILVAPGQPDPMAGQAVEAPAPAPEPTVTVRTLDTPEARAAARIEDRMNRGLTDSITIGKHKMTFQGTTFTERQKLTANKAARAVLNGVPVEQALANVDDPKLREGIIKMDAQRRIQSLVGSGLFDEKQAAEMIAHQYGRDMIPKEYADLAFGPSLAADKAAATAAATAPTQIDVAGRSRAAQNEADINTKPTDDNRIALLLQNQGLQPGTREYEDAFQAEKAKLAKTTATGTAEATQEVLSRYNPNDVLRAAGRLRIPIPPPGQGYSAEDQRRIQEEITATKADEASKITTARDEAGRPKEERARTFEQRQQERTQKFQQRQQEREQKFAARQKEIARREQLRRDQADKEFRRREREAGQQFQAGQQDERITAENARQDKSLTAAQQRQASAQQFQMEQQGRAQRFQMRMAEDRQEAVDARQRRAQKFQSWMKREDVRQRVALKKLDQRLAQNKPLSPTEIQQFVDPKTGDPAPFGMSARQIIAQGYKPVGTEGKTILRNAKTAVEVLQQYEQAASKVFTSENPNANAVNYYRQWLSASPEYQDLLSESGKLSSIIRLLGDRGALSEGDVSRGENTLLQMRARISGSQVKQSVAEVRALIRKGVATLGVDADTIIPEPTGAAGGVVNLDEIN